MSQCVSVYFRAFHNCVSILKKHPQAHASNVVDYSKELSCTLTAILSTKRAQIALYAHSLRSRIKHNTQESAINRSARGEHWNIAVTL
uniref:Uncharacterized protein n=1 Tax=Romanomermis culicivorax TaxID=13658 RepID=A0A915KP54_ROMCU